MRLTKFPSALTILFVSLFFIACDDDSTELGAEMMPSSDKFTGLEINDLVVTANQYNYDEYASQSDLVYFGVATDPVFGEISASLLNELILEEEAANYDGLTKVVDSVKLHLYFDRTMYKNSTNNMLSLAIYSMTDTLSLDSTYKNSIDFDHYCNQSTLLSSNVIDIQDKLIKIDFPSSSLSFFQKIVDLDSAEVLNRNSLHKAGVYGLAFKPLAVSGNGIIARLNTGEYDSTYLDIYYHVKTISAKTNADTTISSYLKMSFISNWYDTADYSYSTIIYGNAKTNPIKYDYSKASVKTVLNGATDDSLFYIIGEGGQKAKLNFSNLLPLSDTGKYNILQAELSIPYDPALTKLTKLSPSGIGMYIKNNDHFVKYADSIHHYSKYKEPSIDTATDSYIFNMTEYVNHKLRYPSFTDDLYLLNSYSFSSVILNKNRIKLKIKYIKL